jgi:hypothetical protein
MNATNVAQWNGTSWSALGNGLGGPLTALARCGGYLYAGGGFTNANLAITNLARWNGTAWSAVGTGPNRVVRDLLSDGTNLYVGGDFTILNGLAANRIARWDGTNWWTLGAGVEGFGVGVIPGVYKMAFDASYRLYAVGNFNEAGNVAVSHAAGWDGTNWFALGGTTSKGVTHFDGDVEALYADGTNLCAGGLFPDAGDVIVDGVAQWDGTSWQAMGSPAAGMVPSTTSTQVKAFVRGLDEFWAGGSFTNIGGITAQNIAMWNGYYWNNVGDADAPVRALAFDGNYFWVGGSFTNIGNTYYPGLANNWPDGGAWFSYGTVSGGGQTVYAIAVDGSDVYVGGNFTSVGGVSAANIIHWDGFEFLAMGSGVNNTVDAIAAANGTVYVGGAFTSAGGVSVNRLAQWNGSSWSALGSGVSTTSGSTPLVSALLLQGSDLYVAGSFTNAGGAYAAGLAKWDGSNWFSLGSGLYSTIFSTAGSGHSLAAMGNDIYVGGLFTTAGDKPAVSIARWNDQLNFYPAPHLQLTRSAWLTNRQYQFRVAGTSGQSYIVQASTNLSTWTPILTNSATLFDFTDTNAVNFPKRFYRAGLGP